MHIVALLAQKVKEKAAKNAWGVREGREGTWKAESMRNEGVPNLKRVSLEGQEVKQNVSRRSGFNEMEESLRKRHRRD